MRASIQVSFRGKYYFSIIYHCYSERFQEDKPYQVYCNVTNEEFRLKIPQEGTKKCVQVSLFKENIMVYTKTLFKKPLFFKKTSYYDLSEGF